MERGRKNKIEGKVIPAKSGLQTDFSNIIGLENEMLICVIIVFLKNYTSYLHLRTQITLSPLLECL